MEIQFSMIIPVYNAEKTIIRCLNSILQSERNDFEILVIDDGSVDHTFNICQKFVTQDVRVKYYRKENGGVSSARNVGVRLAVGRYICFVDSDDFILKDYFERVCSALNDNCDLLIFGKKTYDGRLYKTERYKSCFVMKQEKVVTFLCTELRKQKLNFVCDKVFRRDLIIKYNIEFPEQLCIGEDKVFVIKYITVIQNVKCINAPIYVSSIENKESLSRRIRKDLCDSVILEHNLMNAAIENSDLPSYAKKRYLSVLGFSYYRSAYTVIREMERVYLTRPARKNINKIICKRYKNYGLNYKTGIRTWLLSLPVKLEVINVISLMIKCKNWRKKVEL